MTNPSAPFLNWCESPAAHLATDGAAGSLTCWRWLLDLAMELEPLAGHPKIAANAAEWLDLAGLTESVYQSGLESLRVGTLPDPATGAGSPGLAVLDAAAKLRLLAAGFLSAEPRLAGVHWWEFASLVRQLFEGYQSDLHETRRFSAAAKRAELHIRAAVEELETAGIDSPVWPALVWGAGSNPKHVEAVRQSLERFGYRIWPPDACETVSLKGCLRELAAGLTRVAPASHAQETWGEIETTRTFRRYALRHCRAFLHDLAARDRESNTSGLNQLTARLCSVILAEEITAPIVAEAIRGTSLPRAYTYD